MTQIQNIIAQLQRQRTAIDTAIAALRGIDDQPTVVTSGPGSTATQPGAVSEGRQRQIEAMRRYWAGKKSAPKKAAGGITPAGRKRLAEAMRQRWAARRAAPNKKR